MRILYLGEQKKLNFFGFLNSKGNVDWKSTKINVGSVKKYDWIVSYGYRHVISKSVIDEIINPIINLHISYLPYNRGADPNYWSFVDKTPKGVSIHFIDYGLDTGPILIQKKCKFNYDDTLKTSYEKLNLEVEKLFIENFEDIISGKITAKMQKGKGSYHRKSDLPENIKWDININEI